MLYLAAVSVGVKVISLHLVKAGAIRGGHGSQAAIEMVTVAAAANTSAT